MNLRSLPSTITLLCLLAFASGCLSNIAVGGGLDSMKGKPLQGPANQPDFWPEAEAVAGDQQLYASGVSGWALPLQLSMRSAMLGLKAEDYSLNRFAWNDLGIPILLQLPLRIGWKSEYYKKGESKPTTRNWAQWTPLWATSHTEGVPPKVGLNAYTVRADGIPLIASRQSLERPGGAKIRWYSMLWSFGPQVISFQGKARKTRGFIAVPAMLSGIFGPLVWTSAQVQLDESRITAHGPLAGFLGYAFNGHPVTIQPGEKKLVLNQPKDESELAGRRRHRLVLGGLLWRDDSVTVISDGRTWQSQHGILWALIGWGHRGGGQLRVRFFGLG